MTDRNSPSQQQKLLTGLADDAEFWFAVRGDCFQIVAESVQRGGGVHGERGGVANLRARGDFDGHTIVIECDGAYRRAKREEEIADGPAGRIGIVGVVAIVGDDVAVNLFQSFGNGFVHHLRENFFGGDVYSTFPA